MPRFNAGLGNTTIGFVTLDKDDYEFELSAPKIINRTNDKGPVYGVMYVLKVTKGPDKFVGKSVPYSLYLHSDKAAGMVKRFAMAALGFPLNEAGETEYNAKYGGVDDSVDTDSNEVGELWHKIAGSTVAASVEVKPQRNDPSKEQNEFTWRPV